jgi:decaprenyl-phosphate phosphoribosyltransferase
MIAFTLVACAVYAANDVMDAESDRRHPAKRLRPVASGRVGPRAALAVSAVCALSGLSLAAVLGWPTAAVVAGYALSSGAYVLWLRNLPVLDVTTVAVGFVLRALAGATAAHLVVSSWFLLVALFGSLFLVCAKRRAELVALGSGSAAGGSRRTLSEYGRGWLDQVVTLSLTSTVLAYAMWAFQDQRDGVARTLLGVTVLPTLVALLRYLHLVDQGLGERPERTIADPLVVGAAAVWCVLVTAGIYLT